MFNTLLIANRGEIACRIIKTAHRLGITCVAVYSTADRDALHVAMADHAYCIGEPAASASYLNISAIIQAAIESGAEAIHPGYGFLSENPQFARACEAAGLVFVGPSVHAMEAMASKQLAKQLLANTTVPLTPGYHGSDQSDMQLLQEARKTGFPVLLKAASGGGGKGMRVVHSEADFQAELEGARREATSSFGDEIMIIEKYITQPRHIEIQIMADNHGHVVHLFERDCSIQRRHQKIIEEAPAPQLTKTLRQRLAEAAISVCKTIDYRGAGTVEFLVDQDDRCYFMEMNTRLQVEHPVTEMITGLDLVEWQLRIAANEPLPLEQKAIQAKGHAIECRIYAEDPHQHNRPSIGTIDFIKSPQGDGLRIDTGIQCHSTISRYYDPMVAKLIAHGDTREEAIQRLTHALQHYAIGGVKTNIPLLQAILMQPAFRSGKVTTHFLTDYPISLPTPDINEALGLAACVDYANLNPTDASNLHTETFAWQPHLKRHWIWRYRINNTEQMIRITPVNHDTFTASWQDVTATYRISRTESRLTVDDGQQTLHVRFNDQPDYLTFYMSAGVQRVDRVRWEHLSDLNAAAHQLTSPMPATVVAILKKKGDHIKAGERLMVLEAMKMEHAIQAPHDGMIRDIFYNIGDQVNEGVELMALDAQLDSIKDNCL